MYRGENEGCAEREAGSDRVNAPPKISTHFLPSLSDKGPVTTIVGITTKAYAA